MAPCELQEESNSQPFGALKDPSQQIPLCCIERCQVEKLALFDCCCCYDHWPSSTGPHGSRACIAPRVCFGAVHPTVYSFKMVESASRADDDGRVGAHL